MGGTTSGRTQENKRASSRPESQAIAQGSAVERAGELGPSTGSGSDAALSTELRSRFLDTTARTPNRGLNGLQARHVLHLQRKLGNGAVAQMLASSQRRSQSIGATAPQVYREAEGDQEGEGNAEPADVSARQYLGDAPPADQAPSSLNHSRESEPGPHVVDRQLDATVQRGLLDTLGNIASQAAAATLNPVQAILSRIWLTIPDSVKPSLINGLLDATETILDHARSAVFAVMPGGQVWPIIREVLLGFLRTMRAVGDAQKIAMSNRLALLLSGGSTTFTLHFLKGLALGLWDVIRTPYDLIVGLYSGIKLAAQVIGQLTEDDLAHALSMIISQGSAAWDGLVAMLRDPRKAVALVETLWESIKQSAGQIGRGLARGVLELFKLPDDRLGEEAGRMSANIAIDVVLAVVSDGILAALRRVGTELALVSRVAQRGIRAARSIVRMVRSVVEPLREGIGKIARLFRGGTFGKWLERFLEWINRLELAATAVQIGESLKEAGLAEGGAAEGEETELTIAEEQIDLSPSASGSIGRMLIQRANGGGSAAAPSSLAGKPLEDFVQKQLLAGSWLGLPQMDHVIPGQYNPSGHGVDFFAFRVGADGRLHSYRIEVKGKDSQIKSTKEGVQTGPSWTRDKVDKALQNPKLRKKLMDATGETDLARLRKRLLGGRSYVIAPKKVRIKGLRLLGHLRKKVRPKIKRF